MHLPPVSSLGGMGSIGLGGGLMGKDLMSSSIGSNGTIMSGIVGGFGVTPPTSSPLASSLPHTSSNSTITPSSGSGGSGGNTTNAGTPTGATGGGQTAQDKQAQLANEKRRRRRESHNAVERRRRDNINEKISELATLIPECMLDVGGGGFSFSSFLFPVEEKGGVNEC
ncbi:hypothetical protein BDQ12DRAFT_76684 [Crucibulum laeve]|uniref:BHLH domain-containing protein n=1 Tax=Crucibulum laeve TaxID=68775 RepID=A0A5C3M2E3_9AGAR|nr:hypothetical protein BDQ12DRAFT_76684 [Crucibulum laeve]